jgi:hypothetical protein
MKKIKYIWLCFNVVAVVILIVHNLSLWDGDRITRGSERYIARGNSIGKHHQKTESQRHSCFEAGFDSLLKTTCDNFNISEANIQDRHFYFLGHSVTQQYFFESTRILYGSINHGDQCFKGDLICHMKNLHYLWKDWAMDPRTDIALPDYNLLDGCPGPVMNCLNSFFGNASESDVLIVGSGYVYASICQINGENLMRELAIREISDYVELLLKFPGIILYHSLTPNIGHPDFQACISLMNRVIHNAVSNTRIVYIDTNGYLMDKTHLFKDAIHHPGTPSEGIFRIFMAAVARHYDLNQVLNRHDQRGTCGNWAQDYINFHEKAMNELRKTSTHATNVLDIKTLIFRPYLGYNQGFADRLAGLQRTFLLAFCTNRVFLVDWPVIQTLFEEDLIKWRYTSDIISNSSDTAYMNKEVDSHTIEYYLQELARPDSPSNYAMHFNRAASKETLDNSQCGARLKRLGMTVNNLFGCILRLLFKPSDVVLRPWVKTASDILNTNNSVAIHFRFGDKSFQSSIVKGQLNMTFEKAKCLESAVGYEPSRFFLMTDSMTYKKKLIETYPQNFYHLDFQPRHVANSTDVVEYSKLIAEWFLFGLTDFQIIDPNSGLSRTAFAYSQNVHPAFFSRTKNCKNFSIGDLVTEGAML